jgi:hypothetical protein
MVRDQKIYIRDPRFEKVSSVFIASRTECLYHLDPDLNYLDVTVGTD